MSIELIGYEACAKTGGLLGNECLKVVKGVYYYNTQTGKGILKVYTDGKEKSFCFAQGGGKDFLNELYHKMYAFKKGARFPKSDLFSIYSKTLHTKKEVMDLEGYGKGQKIFHCIE